MTKDNGRSPSGPGCQPSASAASASSRSGIPNAVGDGLLVPNAHLRFEELRQATVALIIATEKDSVADWPGGVDYGDLDKAWAAVDGTYPTLWTAEQVEKLNEWQGCGHVHPFTCPNRDDSWHKDEDGEEVTLEAIPQGWVCRSCGYRQFWAHDFMFNGPGPSPFASAIEAAAADETGTGSTEGESATSEAGDVR